MLIPKFSDRFGPQISALAQSAFAQQVFAPIAQRSPQPSVNRQCKTHLGPIYQPLRHIFIEHPPQKVFPDAWPHLHLQRELSSEFNHSMIQKRDTAFQTDGHGSPIELSKNVIGKIGNLIQKHHFLDEGREVRPLSSSIEDNRRGAPSNNNVLRWPPVRHERLTEVFWNDKRKDVRQLVQLLSRQLNSKSSR